MREQNWVLVSVSPNNSVQVFHTGQKNPGVCRFVVVERKGGLSQHGSNQSLRVDRAWSLSGILRLPRKGICSAGTSSTTRLTFDDLSTDYRRYCHKRITVLERIPRRNVHDIEKKDFSIPNAKIRL